MTSSSELNGDGCGNLVVGDKLYYASRGNFGQDMKLYAGNATNGVSAVHDLPELATSLAADATHLYLAFPSSIKRLPLSDLSAAFEDVTGTAGPVGGLVVDDTHVYWADYLENGAVRRLPKK